MELVLDIKGTKYTFKAGFKFMRKADKRDSIKDSNGKEVYMGLTYLIAQIMDENIDALHDALLLMNEGQTPKLTADVLESYLEDEADIDELFKEVLDFFEKSNCTKKTVRKLKEEIEKERAKNQNQ